MHLKALLVAALAIESVVSVQATNCPTVTIFDSDDPDTRRAFVDFRAPFELNGWNVTLEFDVAGVTVEDHGKKGACDSTFGKPGQGSSVCTINAPSHLEVQKKGEKVIFDITILFDPSYPLNTVTAFISSGQMEQQECKLGSKCFKILRGADEKRNGYDGQLIFRHQEKVANWTAKVTFDNDFDDTYIHNGKDVECIDKTCTFSSYEWMNGQKWEKSGDEEQLKLTFNIEYADDAYENNKIPRVESLIMTDLENNSDMEMC